MFYIHKVEDCIIQQFWCGCTENSTVSQQNVDSSTWELCVQECLFIYCTLFVIFSLWKNKYHRGWIEYFPVKACPKGIQTRKQFRLGFGKTAGRKRIPKGQRMAPTAPEKRTLRCPGETPHPRHPVNGRHNKVPFTLGLFTWWCVTPDFSSVYINLLQTKQAQDGWSAA